MPAPHHSGAVRIFIIFVLALFLKAFPTASRADERPGVELAKKVAALVNRDENRLIELFKHLHSNPELGFQEVRTAALVAKEFKELGYETYTGIGKTGVVGILKNGSGPVV